MCLALLCSKHGIPRTCLGSGAAAFNMLQHRAGCDVQEATVQRSTVNCAPAVQASTAAANCARVEIVSSRLACRPLIDNCGTWNSGQATIGHRPDNAITMTN